MSEATVHKLREETKSGGEVVVVPAIGMSIVSNLGGDRQATIQCHVPFEAGETIQNEVLDRMFRVMDRQKARYEIADLEKQLAENRFQLRQFEENYDAVEKTYAVKKVEREAEAEGQSARAEELYREGYDEHVASGRRGEYVPQGHKKQAIDVAKKAAAGISESLKTDEAERLVALENIQKTKDRYHAEIQRLTGEIAHRKEIINPSRPEHEPDGA